MDRLSLGTNPGQQRRHVSEAVRSIAGVQVTLKHLLRCPIIEVELRSEHVQPWHVTW